MQELLFAGGFFPHRIVNIQVAGQAVREILKENRCVRRCMAFLAIGLELVLRMVTLNAGYLGMQARRGAQLVDNFAVAGVAGFCCCNSVVSVDLQW